MTARFKSFVASKWLRYTLIALSGLAVVVLVFGAGYVAGRLSVLPVVFARGQPRDLGSRTGHGAIGVIESIDGQRITIQSRDGKLETILVNDDTRFDKNLQKISFTDLKLKDQIVVLGSPNDDGEINARLIGLIEPSNSRFFFGNFSPPVKPK
jgi:uncharacterized protein DUF5666